MDGVQELIDGWVSQQQQHLDIAAATPHRGWSVVVILAAMGSRHFDDSNVCVVVVAAAAGYWSCTTLRRLLSVWYGDCWSSLWYCGTGYDLCSLQLWFGMRQRRLFSSVIGYWWLWVFWADALIQFWHFGQMLNLVVSFWAGEIFGTWRHPTEVLALSGNLFRACLIYVTRFKHWPTPRCRYS